jgi:hypothetical protein
MIRGTSNATTPSTIKKMISTTKKVPLGTRKLLLPPSSAANTVTLWSPIVVNDYLSDVANTMRWVPTSYSSSLITAELKTG